MLLRFTSVNGIPFLLNSTHFKKVVPLIPENLELGSQILFMNGGLADYMDVAESVDEIWAKVNSNDDLGPY